MGLFGPSKREIAEAVAEALATTLPAALKSITLPAPVVNVASEPIDFDRLAEATATGVGALQLPKPQVKVVGADADAIADAVGVAVSGLNLPAPEVTIENTGLDAEQIAALLKAELSPIETTTPEIRPARGWETITEEMIGKDLPVRPHALWANGPMKVTLVDDIGTEAVFEVRYGGHPIDASPVQVKKIVADPGVTLLALYP